MMVLKAFVLRASLLPGDQEAFPITLNTSYILGNKYKKHHIDCFISCQQIRIDADSNSENYLFVRQFIVLVTKYSLGNLEI